MVYRQDTQMGGTMWSTASRAIGIDPHNGIWLLREGVPVLCSAGKLRSAKESESLALGLLDSQQHSSAPRSKHNGTTEIYPQHDGR